MPRARSAEERAFLALGPGAERWLIAAAAAGTSKLRRKLAEAVALAKLHGEQAVEEALTVAAQAERFGDGDLAAILAHHQGGQLIAFPSYLLHEVFPYVGQRPRIVVALNAWCRWKNGAP